MHVKSASKLICTEPNDFSHWRKSDDMRESVREYKIEKLADSAYIPVLDRDPEFAARFLLKKEVPK